MPQGASTEWKGDGGALLALYVAKLDAMRKLCLHVGLIAPHPSLAPSVEETVAQHIGRWGWAVPLAAVVIMSDQAHPIQKTAAAMVLDIFAPGWRDEFPQLVGQVIDRGDYRVQLWRAAVFERDGHRCVECGAEDGLHAHHIVRWVDAPFMRLAVENGKTLCQQCHVDEHAKQAA